MNTRRIALTDIDASDLTSANAELWLDKFITKQEREASEIRRDLVNKLSAFPVPEAYNEFYKQWEKMLTGYGALTRKATVIGRMIVGLGNESVLETSITLHRTYGVPYIPGSALKGLAASYAQQKLSEEWHTGGEAHKIIFGDTDNAGYIVFFDALYIPENDKVDTPLKPDIITVHHPEYYQGTDKAPADWDSPTPIPFLTATGSYLIAVAAPDLEKGSRDQWLNTALKIIEGALETLGIGAKTSSGYGRMKVEVPPVDPELQKAKGYVKEVNSMLNKDVANQIQAYYQKWQQVKSNEGRFILATAIVGKIDQAGRAKVTAEKSWYKDLQTYLANR